MSIGSDVQNGVARRSAEAPVRAGPAERRSRQRSPILWFFRALLVVPYVLMGPELVSVALGRWHVPLRREYGLGMFAVAASDLVIAAVASANRFPGGFLTRVGGHGFLLAGTLSTMLALPLALTANLRARRWLGRHWKWLHRLTYALWVTILIHLAFLFAFRTFFVDALVLSVALVAFRIPALHRWWSASRRAGTHRKARWMWGVALVGLFAVGFIPFLRELALVGMQALRQHPN